MKKILVVMGSAREGRAADNVAKFVTNELTTLGVEPVIADLHALNLPFFNNPLPPSSEGYSTSEPSALAWGKLVKESDGVVLLTPEYNHGTSALLKNAIDWLSAEWIEKPVAIIGYGWSGGSHAIADITESMHNLKATLHPETASLYFMKNIAVDGSPIEGEAKAVVEPVLTSFIG